MSDVAISTVDIGQVLRALSKAPSVHATQPWALEPGSDAVSLVERFDVTLPACDPLGRDRTISCGAALTNVVVAIRALGGAGRITLQPKGKYSELVATVTTTPAEAPTAKERALREAVDRRHSYRLPFSLRTLTWRDRNALQGALSGQGVTSHVVRRAECAALADLLDYAAKALGDNAAYQRELLAWQPQFPLPLPADSTLPWSGQVRSARTRICQIDSR